VSPFDRDGIRERAFLVAEQLAFDQCLGDGAAIDGNDVAPGAPAAAENLASDDLFAGAAFARNQHRVVEHHDAPDSIDE
jgi:hypothetical protein